MTLASRRRFINAARIRSTICRARGIRHDCCGPVRRSSPLKSSSPESAPPNRRDASTHRGVRRNSASRSSAECLNPDSRLVRSPRSICSGVAAAPSGVIGHDPSPGWRDGYKPCYTGPSSNSTPNLIPRGSWTKERLVALGGRPLGTRFSVRWPGDRIGVAPASVEEKTTPKVRDSMPPHHDPLDRVLRLVDEAHHGHRVARPHLHRAATSAATDSAVKRPPTAVSCATASRAVRRARQARGQSARFAGQAYIRRRAARAT